MARSSDAPGRLATGTTRRAFNFRYFGEVASELRRVTWPAREETMRLSIMVISVAAAVGAFLGIFDLIFSKLFDLLLRN